MVAQRTALLVNNLSMVVCSSSKGSHCSIETECNSASARTTTSPEIQPSQGIAPAANKTQIPKELLKSSFKQASNTKAFQVLLLKCPFVATSCVSFTRIYDFA
eukprot:5539725-Amphidinium_carterae.1